MILTEVIINRLLHEEGGGMGDDIPVLEFLGNSSTVEIEEARVEEGDVEDRPAAGAALQAA